MSRFFSGLLFYGLVVPISRLPFRVLYWFSDFLYFVIFYVAGYRKEVVLNNLKRAFPDTDESELLRIRKRFYRHFADFLVESAKALTISDKQIRRRCSIVNPELPHSYYEKGQNIIVLCGHYNNWEYYAVGLAQQMKHKTIAAYKPLKNRFFNDAMLRSRQRFGTQMVSIRDIPRFYANMNGTPTMTIMVNDQSPANPQQAYWNCFLNQETGWMTGTAKLAQRYDQPVLFGCIRKKKRGFYEVTFYHITDTPQQMSEGAIIDQHAHLLEGLISEHPEYWLWSHKRWKHKKPVV